MSLYCKDGSQHQEGKGKWHRRFFCDIEVRPQYKIHCEKCGIDMSNFMIVKGLGIYRQI